VISDVTNLLIYFVKEDNLNFRTGSGVLLISSSKTSLPMSFILPFFVFFKIRIMAVSWIKIIEYSFTSESILMVKNYWYGGW